MASMPRSVLFVMPAALSAPLVEAARSWGCPAEAAEGTDEAVAKARTFESTVVFIEVNRLGDGDEGCRAAALMKRLPRPPLRIAVTSEPVDGPELMMAGFNLDETKPLLAETVKSYLCRPA